MHTWGRLDAAVAAAAIIVGGKPLWETPPEHLQSLLDVDVVGVWNTAAATIPLMLANPEPAPTSAGRRTTAAAREMGC